MVWGGVRYGGVSGWGGLILCVGRYGVHYDTSENLISRFVSYTNLMVA